MGIKDLFESDIPGKFAADPGLASGLGAVVHFDITGEGGGQWTIDGTKSEGWVSPGKNGDAKMTVVCSAEDFEKIASKKLNPQMAAMTQKLKFRPLDMGLAMKLGKIIG